MSKFCIEEITMGFSFLEPKSIFYGHFESKEEALIWARNKYQDWEEIDEGEIFFQKDLGTSVKESYIHDCEDENFINYSDYKTSKIISR